jgi:hypothetical protein
MVRVSFPGLSAQQKSLCDTQLDFDLTPFYVPKTAIATKKTANNCQLCCAEQPRITRIRANFLKRSR